MHRPVRPSHRLTVWRFFDGRPGHENQVKGLCEAIARIRNLDAFDVVVDQNLRGLRSLLPGRFQFAGKLPRPDLLIGAGHSTHLPLVACRRLFGGRSVVIMKPSLPTVLFDQCLIPAHDTLVFPTKNVVRTEGALNGIRPAARLDDSRGLILIGGPSKHFQWSDEGVMGQIQAIVRESPVRWTVATSERTSQSFIHLWKSMLPQFPLTVWGSCDQNWLPDQLAECGSVWVTCDSMSMIYEAMTAGARVGLLELPVSVPGRIAANVRRLTDMSLATSWSQWMNGRELSKHVPGVSESDRCSLAVIEHCITNAARLPRRKTFREMLGVQQSPESTNGRPENTDSLLHVTPGVTA